MGVCRKIRFGPEQARGSDTSGDEAFPKLLMGKQFLERFQAREPSLPFFEFRVDLQREVRDDMQEPRYDEAKRKHKLRRGLLDVWMYAY